MAPDGVGAPGIIHALIEEVILAHPGGAVEDAGEGVGEVLPGVQILDAQRKALITGDIGGIGQVASRGGYGGGAQGEELMSLREFIRIKEHLLVRAGFHGDLRGHPGFITDGHAAEDAVALAFLGASEVPVLTPADRNRHVGFLHA